MSAVQDWSSLFLPEAALDRDAVDIEIDEEDDGYVEVTGDMLLALPEVDDPDDEVTEPLPELNSEEVEKDWPRSWEAHLQDLHRLVRDDAATESLAVFGLGDVRGCEETAAAIACTWENLRFWEPMLELGVHGDFNGHLADLRSCQELLEAHPAPVHRADMLERWEQARTALRRALPAQQSPQLHAKLTQRFTQRGRGTTQVTLTAVQD